MKLSNVVPILANVATSASPRNPRESSAIDCLDGANGGCSHFCNDVSKLCECPSCWSLQADEKSCLPDSDKVSITCSQAGMTIEVDECVYTDGTDEVTIGFNEDAACQSTTSNGMHSVQTALDGCGTTVSDVEGNIVFSNNVQVTSRVNPFGLVMNGDIDFAVSCSFDTLVNDISVDLSVKSDVHSSGTNGSGQFSFVANYYQTSDFTTVSTYNDTKIVGETLFFGISPTNSIQNIKFYVNECTVSDNNHEFTILGDMCPDNIIVTDTSSFINTDMFTMNYHAFTFKDSSYSNAELSCPSGWHLNGEKCFKIGDKNIKRTSYENCASMGGFLAVPENDAERNFIVSLMEAENGDLESVWLGMNDSHEEGTFRHDRTKENLSYVPLDNTTPNTVDVNSIVLQLNGLYKVVESTYESHHVCQKDASDQEMYINCELTVCIDGTCPNDPTC